MRVKVASICPRCACGCGIGLVLEQRRVVGAEGRGRTADADFHCRRWADCHREIERADRLKTPLVRAGKEFCRIGWGDAFSEIAKELNVIRTKHGDDAVGFIFSGSCTNEECYLIQKFARLVVGTNNVDNTSGKQYRTMRNILVKATGRDNTSHDMPDLGNSAHILAINSDPVGEAPALLDEMLTARENGARIVVLDSRRNASSAIADESYTIREGKAAMLVNSLCYSILEADLEDDRFIRERTADYGTFKAGLAECAPERVQGLVGLSADEIRKIAKDYASAKPAAVLCSEADPELAAALSNLVMLTGNYGKAGGGLNIVLPECNSRGACDAGCLPDAMQGGPKTKGAGMDEMITLTREGKIKALFVFGAELDTEGFDGTELLVVAGTHPTTACEMADYILPTACWAEEDGTFTDMEGTTQKIRAAMLPPGEARKITDIIKGLAGAMGRGEQFYYAGMASVLEEMANINPKFAVKGYDDDSNGIVAQAILNPPFKSRFDTSDGFGRFIAIKSLK